MLKFNWADYSSVNAAEVEAWMDREAVRFTGCDDGWDKYVEYWANEKDTKVGENFWFKVVYTAEGPFAVIAVSMDENGEFCVSEFIIAPALRGKGFGTAALLELLKNGYAVIGHDIKKAYAVIFPNNTASQKAFEKAGFAFDHANPDGDALIYKYEKNMICFCGHDCSRCLIYCSTVNDSDEMREKSRKFYLEEFGFDIPKTDIHCLGGRSDDVFRLCQGCPWMKCCRERGIVACSECGEYPCKPLAEYTEKYVNKCNQTED